MLYLHLSRASTAGSSDIAFSQPVGGRLFGEADLARVDVLSSAAPGAVALDVVSDGLSAPCEAPDWPVFCMLFDLHSGNGVEAMTRYVAARAPSLERHQGRLLLSATHAPVGGWPFHGIELIAFPSPSSLQAIMGDPVYQQATAEAATIFAGAFSVLILGKAPVAA